jgi:hypothetical protein
LLQNFSGSKAKICLKILWAPPKGSVKTHGFCAGAKFVTVGDEFRRSVGQKNGARHVFSIENSRFGFSGWLKLFSTQGIKVSITRG